jgi:hypothetical protein
MKSNFNLNVKYPLNIFVDVNLKLFKSIFSLKIFFNFNFNILKLIKKYLEEHKFNIFLNKKYLKKQNTNIKQTFIFLLENISK